MGFAIGQPDREFTTNGLGGDELCTPRLAVVGNSLAVVVRRCPTVDPQDVGGVLYNELRVWFSGLAARYIGAALQEGRQIGSCLVVLLWR